MNRLVLGPDATGNIFVCEGDQVLHFGPEPPGLLPEERNNTIAPSVNPRNI